MGKRIISQRRGRGTSTYRSHSFKAKAPAKYVHQEKAGKVVDLIHCPGHTSPLAKIKYETGQVAYLVAPEGLYVGQELTFGAEAKVTQGNALPLGKIPAGSFVFNIESKPEDGGKFVRSSGTFAKVVSKLEGKVVVLMPSKKQKIFDEKCWATLGVVSGGGKREKPLLKGGKKHFAMRARGRLYPHISGVAQNAVDHPFGSSRGRNIGKTKAAPRFAPAGRKVGQIAPKRTGRKR